jgi:hypothetical protein
MNVGSRIGQSAVAAFAAALLTLTIVGAAAGPVTAAPHGVVAAPAALVAAQVSSQVFA